jgi:hypothetical protein
VPIDVGFRSLTNSAVELGKGADQLTGSPSHLLRFYAVECRLKAMLLRRRNLSSTSQLEEDLRSHDLRRLATELRLDPAAYRDLRRCRRRANGGRAGRSIEAVDMHQVWRYGLGVEDEDEKAFVAGLISLEQRCREELGR